MILRQKIIFFPILGGARAGCAPPPPGSAPTHHVFIEVNVKWISIFHLFFLLDIRTALIAWYRLFFYFSPKAMTYHAGESVVINIIYSAWIINTKIGSRSTYNGSDAIHNAFIYKI